MRVPTKHEEVNVERVAVNEETPDAEIGEDDVSMPVVEEEVVAEKKAVVKEELRIKKDVVEDEEVVGFMPSRVERRLKARSPLRKSGHPGSCKA